MSAAEPEVIRKRSDRLVYWFGRYAGRFLKRNFHAVRILKGGTPEDDKEIPLVVYCNHPSWNDPMVLLFVSQHFFPDRAHYGPIDADALEGYGIFKRLGFFGVKPGTASGAREFLRIADAIFRHGQTGLWITAQGDFTDVRKRPVRLQPGLGAAIHRADRALNVLPLAIEYSFGEERYPEIFLAFGPPVKGEADSADGWTELCEQGLETMQDRLAEAVIERDLGAFENLAGGAAGVGGIYGLWKRVKAFFTGKNYDPHHSSLSES